jgi:hypothetical protein
MSARDLSYRYRAKAGRPRARSSHIELMYRRLRRRGSTLSLAQFVELHALPCFYCGGALPEFGPGLDRIDNRLGYEPGNVLPACGRCNVARGALLSVDEFKAAMDVRRARLGLDADLWSEYADVKRGGANRGRRESTKGRRRAAIRQEVLEILSRGPQPSRQVLVREVTGNSDIIIEEIRAMVSEGLLACSGYRRPIALAERDPSKEALHAV